MTDPIGVRILDREYLVACPPDEREGLVAAANLLDSRMREIRSSNRMAGIDRIAVLAALNLAHELSQQRQGGSNDQRAVSRVIDDLSRRIDILLETVTPGR